MKKMILFLVPLFILTALHAQDRQSLLLAALKNSNAGDSTFYLRDSVVAHLYYDAESDSMLFAGLKSETYLTTADVQSMRMQLWNSKPHCWTKDSIGGAMILTSGDVPNNDLSPSKCVKAWTKYFDTHKKGYFEMSDPVFSKDMKTAIIYTSFQCGANCGNGGATVFRFEGGEWKPVKNIFSFQKGGQ